MVKCSAYRCENATYKKTPGLTFHRFPKDESIMNAWLTNMKLHAEGHLQDWEPNPYSLLCSKHFESHFFDIGSSRTRLRCKAIPTIFDESPLTGQIKKEISTSITSAPDKPSASGILLLQEVKNEIMPVASTYSSKNVINVDFFVEVNVADIKAEPSKNKIIPVASTPLLKNVEDNEPDPLNTIPQSLSTTQSSRPIPCKTDKVDSLKRKLISKNKKIKALRQKCTRLRKKVSQFSGIISELKKQLNQDDIHIFNNIPGNN